MTLLVQLAAALLLPASVLSLRHSKLVSLACAVPLVATIAILRLDIDMSSDSHPLRFAVPLITMALGFTAAFLEARQGHARSRAAILGIVVFSSGAGDVAALPAFRLLGEWAVPYLQICVCLALITISVWPKGWKEPWSSSHA